MLRSRRGRPALGSLLALVLVLAAFGGSPASAVDEGLGCESNQATDEPGATDLSSEGHTHFKTSTTNDEPTGPGDIRWNVHAQILPPNTNTTPANQDLLRGFLRARVDYASGDSLVFASNCVQTVHTSPGFLNEAEYRGTGCVNGACFFAGATIQLEKVAPTRANLDFQMIGCCTVRWEISKDNAVAPGSKTGNGERHVVTGPV